MVAFSRSARSGVESIEVSAVHEPGRGIAVSVLVPGLDPSEIANARVVFKQGEQPVVGVPLGAVQRNGRTLFQAVAPESGQWDAALVLVEKHNRALLVKEAPRADLEAALLQGGIPLPELPGGTARAAPMGAVDRVAVTLELVVKEALLLPGPLDRLLFG